MNATLVAGIAQVIMLNHVKATLAALIAAFSLVACEPTLTNAPEGTASATGPDQAVDTSAAAQFAAVQSPVRRTALVIGSYTRGCIAGAEQLPTNAPHWQVLNPSRNRSWAHPILIQFVHHLSDQIAADGYEGLLLGDFAQPRGGPLPSDHNSHQVGLDADIWLTPLSRVRLTAEELETFEPPTMVDVTTLKTNRQFGSAQYAMLKHAAQSPDVERIFVSPPIKQTLCDRTSKSSRDWLRKIRPWRGHMSHMHVRLACPAGSEDCTSQDPPPEGDGCGAELASWFKDRSWTTEGTRRYEPEKAMRLDGMPPQCQKLLKEHG
ncbi:MAG: penicillin-insensitive murein endopeptidase [Micropepsaceae bacterium]